MFDEKENHKTSLTKKEINFEMQFKPIYSERSLKIVGPIEKIELLTERFEQHHSLIEEQGIDFS